jgi:hypothetical protein
MTVGRYTRIGAAAVALLAGVPGAARADETHGYCDYVEGVAAAESALMFSPTLFGSVGKLEQNAVTGDPTAASEDLRYTAGVAYSLTGVVEGILTRKRAKAECHRHEALAQVQSESTYHALDARRKVLDEALEEADEMLARASEELDRRTATAQEVLSTRVRVDELRAMAADTKLELEALPKPAAGVPMKSALTTLYRADATLERSDARLREMKALDVSVRVGYDSFLGTDGASPYFAVLTVSFNPGWIVQRGANKKAASGRRHLVQEEYGTHQVDTTTTRLNAMLEVERKRLTETGALVDDLDTQLRQLERIGGEGSRRLRETVWFEWVKARADHEYLVAHVAALEEILGAEAEVAAR